ncbi:MAG: 6-bladed beta-propeller [Balneolaceae bacterium]
MGFQKYLYGTVLLLIFSVSCGKDIQQPAEIRTSEIRGIELHHEFTISDSEDVFLLQITGVKTDSKGRIYLTDQRALSIHVFDKEGEYLKSIGREGSGPGEFQSILRTFIDQQDRLITYDVRQARNIIFEENNEDWKPEQVFMIEGHRYGIESADAEGNVILRQSSPQYPEHGAFWYEHELATANLETGLKEQNVLMIKDAGFLVLENGTINRIPFGRTTVLATGLNGNLYQVWNEQFELTIYNTKMEAIDSLQVHIPNQPISKEEKNEALEGLGDEFRSLGREHIPYSKPVIANMFIDGNENIWLQTFDSPEYLVLNKKGDPVGSFDLQDNLRLAHVDQNRIYAIEYGETGIEIYVFSFQL